MKNETLSELHEIGKLGDAQALKKVAIEFNGSQTFQNFDFSQLDTA
jgi:hypothetical protein